MDLRLHIASIDNGALATVTAEAHPEPGPGTEAIHHIEVHTYWHTPEDGSAPYLVVEVDTDDDPPLKVYVNDGPVTLAIREG